MKRAQYHFIVLYIGITGLLSSVAYSLLTASHALADKSALSTSACEAFGSALQPATIAALASACVTCCGAIVTVIKQFQQRPPNNTSTEKVTSVKVSAISQPPELK